MLQGRGEAEEAHVSQVFEYELRRRQSEPQRGGESSRKCFAGEAFGDPAVQAIKRITCLQHTNPLK